MSPRPGNTASLLLQGVSLQSGVNAVLKTVLTTNECAHDRRFTGAMLSLDAPEEPQQPFRTLGLRPPSDSAGLFGP